MPLPQRAGNIVKTKQSRCADHDVERTVLEFQAVPVLLFKPDVIQTRLMGLPSGNFERLVRNVDSEDTSRLPHRTGCVQCGPTGPAGNIKYPLTFTDPGVHNGSLARFFSEI